MTEKSDEFKISNYSYEDQSDGCAEREREGFYDSFSTAPTPEYADYERYTFTVYGLGGHKIWADEEGFVIKTPKGEEYTWFPSNARGATTFYELPSFIDIHSWDAYWDVQEGTIRSSARLLEPEEAIRFTAGQGCPSQCLAQFWATPQELAQHEEKWGFTCP